MSGVGLEVIGKLLGHSDIKTTRRYAHLADVVVRAATESTADQIAKLMKFEGAANPPGSPAPTSATGKIPKIRAAAAAFGARRSIARPNDRQTILALSTRAPDSAAPLNAVQIDLSIEAEP